VFPIRNLIILVFTWLRSWCQNENNSVP